jgi:uncharacterized membrane protein
LEQSSEIPQLVHELLSLKTRPLSKLQHIEQNKQLAYEQRRESKKTYAILTSGFGIVTALLFALDASTTKYFAMTLPTLGSLSMGLIFLYKALRNP